jgi:His-Xaa-Ser system protein HxsD
VTASVTAAEATFALSVYTLDAVKKAAYRLSDRASPEISIDGERVSCKLHFGTPVSIERSEEILTDLRNEVLDQDLRERIADETAPLRNAILAHVFSGSGLQE